MQNTIIECYNVEEEFLYSDTYSFIKGYASGYNCGQGLTQTLRALPLARQMHNGQYRKGEVVVNGKKYHLPYVSHVLRVCSILISLNLPLNTEELDTLLAASLLHDVKEDCEEFFPLGGEELTSIYGFNPMVCKIVQTVSKRAGYSEEQLDRYFNSIKTLKLALLIKLADRSHNVEDLYNMKPEKLHKYIKETKNWIYSIAAYGKANYPELSNSLTILKDHISSLTENTETLVDKYEDLMASKDAEIAELKASLASKVG
mgnify:CR=1 FL=1